MIFLTIPVVPSNSILSPVFILSSNPVIPTTAGIPSSLETIAECDNKLPLSTRIPLEAGNNIIQPGSVNSATNISPCSIFAFCGSFITLAIPVIFPGDAPIPFNSIVSSSFFLVSLCLLKLFTIFNAPFV